MQYSAYPDRSPTEEYLWSKDIPSHWKTIRLGFLIEMLVGNAFSSEKFQYEGGIRLVRGDNVTEGRLRWGDKQRCWPEVTKDIERYLLSSDDILIGMDGSKVGKNFAQVHQDDLPLLLVQRVARLRSTSDLYPSYLRYLIGCPLFLSWVEQRKTDPMVPHITAKDIRNYRICCPDYEEQQTIARFLDFKTAQIDALIAKKKALLDKLAEKRTALISHAVTKGLDPSVPMKDSGVEWLGEIPGHWEPKKIKYFTQILRGKFSHRPRNDPRFYDGDYPFIQTGDVARAQKFITGYSQTLNEDGLKVSREFPAGTLVMTIAANIGDMAILNFDACFPDSIVGFVPQDNVNLDYLFYMFTAMRQQLLTTAVLNTQLNLNIERIADQFGACPPLVEQIEIAKYLESIELKLSEQALSISNAVERLQEYRSALITNAVTGKIDVRDWEAA